MSISDRDVGQRIEVLRGDRTQADFASLLQSHGLKWSQGTLSKVEQGQRPVRLTEAMLIADALGTTLDQLGFRPERGLSELAADARWAERRSESGARYAQRRASEAQRARQVVDALVALRDDAGAAFTVAGMDWADLVCIAAKVDLSSRAPLPEGFLDPGSILRQLGVPNTIDLKQAELPAATYEQANDLLELQGAPGFRERFADSEGGLLRSDQLDELAAVLAVQPFVPDLAARFPNVTFGPFAEVGGLIYYGEIERSSSA